MNKQEIGHSERMEVNVPTRKRMKISYYISYIDDRWILIVCFMKRRIRDVVFTFLFISNSSYAIVYTKGDYRQILMKVHPIFQYSMNHMVNNHYSFAHTDIDEVYVFLKLPHRRSHAK